MTKQEQIEQAVEKFWETIPPAWHATRAVVRGAAAEKFHLTEEQFQVLRRIRRGSASVSALAEASQTSRSAVSKAVEALVRRGLVSRSQNPDDRRNLPLALTDEGQRVMAGVYDETEQWLSARFTRLTAEETESLLLGMESLRKAFTTP
ncbi:MAG: MarR family transcriptional regulator [Anaerolineaceae bacterium]|nr:MAG: MarR family transcriptional regulator [Anaerolineaceae bacterium]